MNLNLRTGEGNFGETMDSPQDEIDEHLEIMRHQAGFNLSGRVALVPEPATPGAGVYQVWCGVDDDTWVWIDPNGEAVVKTCPINEGDEPW